MCHLPELGAAGVKHDKPEGWGHAHCVQVTLSSEEAKEAIAATSASGEAMRHPKLHFQNLLSPTAFGRLWEHSIGLSSRLWSLVSFCAYSQIKWVSRPKGFKLIPPNKKKKKIHYIYWNILSWPVRQRMVVVQSTRGCSGALQVKYFISPSATSTYQKSLYEVTINTKILCLFLMLLAK